MRNFFFLLYNYSVTKLSRSTALGAFLWCCTSFVRQSIIGVHVSGCLVFVFVVLRQDCQDLFLELCVLFLLLMNLFVVKTKLERQATRIIGEFRVYVKCIFFFFCGKSLTTILSIPATSNALFVCDIYKSLYDNFVKIYGACVVYVIVVCTRLLQQACQEFF